MISVPIEPTFFCFDIVKQLSPPQSGESEISLFKEYFTRLCELIENVEKYKLQIPITAELYAQYEASVPSQESNDSRITLVREFFWQKLPKHIKNVHQFGDHNRELKISSANIQHSALLEIDAYILWLDLLAYVVVCDTIPNTIIRPSVQLSAFNHANPVLVEYDKQRDSFGIFDSCERLKSCPHFCGVELINKTHKETSDITLTLSTGDHSSMWGKGRKKLKDIPSFERELISLLVHSGLVRDITLLKFEKKRPPSPTPIIYIHNVEPGPKSDRLHCEIHGNGTKQNCQDMFIEVEPGCGILLQTFFQGEINLEKAYRIFHKRRA